MFSVMFLAKDPIQGLLLLESMKICQINNGNRTEWCPICIGNYTVSSSIWN